MRVPALKQRTDWDTQVRDMINSEMARQNISYSQMVEKLESIAVKEDERYLRNEAIRGKFTAAFMLQCLSALGASELRLP